MAEAATVASVVTLVAALAVDSVMAVLAAEVEISVAGVHQAVISTVQAPGVR